MTGPRDVRWVPPEAVRSTLLELRAQRAEQGEAAAIAIARSEGRSATIIRVAVVTTAIVVLVGALLVAVLELR